MQHHYIIGIGRSGTTLLQSLLNTHSEVWAGPENYFITFFFNAWKSKTKFSEEDLKLLHRFNIAFEKLQPIVGFTYSFQLPKELPTSFEELIIYNYSNFKNDLYPQKKAHVFINKNPIHSLFLNELNQLNSDSKYIWILRDYRANIYSRIKSLHLFSPNVYLNSVRWQFFYRKIYAFQQKYPEKIKIIRYEDLVDNSEQILSEVLGFLKISREHALVSIHEVYQTLYSETIQTKFQHAERMQKRFGDLSEPISNKHVDKWKKGLTEDQIRIAEFICGSAGKNHGYSNTFPISTKFINKFFIPKLWYQLKLGFSLFKDKIFAHLPIRFKVRYFENWVNKVDFKRKSNVDN